MGLKQKLAAAVVAVPAVAATPALAQTTIDFGGPTVTVGQITNAGKGDARGKGGQANSEQVNEGDNNLTTVGNGGDSNATGPVIVDAPKTPGNEFNATTVQDVSNDSDVRISGAEAGGESTLFPPYGTPGFREMVEEWTDEEVMEFYKSNVLEQLIGYDVAVYNLLERRRAGEEFSLYDEGEKLAGEYAEKIREIKRYVDTIISFREAMMWRGYEFRADYGASNAVSDNVLLEIGVNPALVVDGRRYELFVGKNPEPFQDVEKVGGAGEPGFGPE